jgi:hypothetical protein
MHYSIVSLFSLLAVQEAKRQKALAEHYITGVREALAQANDRNQQLEEQVEELSATIRILQSNATTSSHEDEQLADSDSKQAEDSTTLDNQAASPLRDNDDDAKPQEEDPLYADT